MVIGNTAALVMTSQREILSTRPGGGLVVRSTYAQLRRRLDGRAGALVAMAGIVPVRMVRRVAA
jgi:hypothetical protein